MDATVETLIEHLKQFGPKLNIRIKDSKGILGRKLTIDDVKLMIHWDKPENGGNGTIGDVIAIG